MPLVGAAITKSVPFQGVGERFSNVYYYDVPTADEAHAAAVLDALVAREVHVFAQIVNMVEGRCWSAGGTPAQNVTLLIKDYLEAGRQPTDPKMYRENCWVVGWKTERPSATGKPVHLRKFLHSCTQFDAVPIEDVTNGQAQLPETAQTPLVTYMDAVRNLDTPLGTFQLTAPSGRIATAQGVIDRWLQSREFHR